MSRGARRFGWARNAVGATAVAVALGGTNVLIAEQEPASARPEGERIEAFKIAVADAVLRDLNDRLARTRWPDQIDGTDWEYGVPVAYMQGLVKYWRTGYNWREQETKLNKLDQFVTRI